MCVPSGCRQAGRQGLALAVLLCCEAGCLRVRLGGGAIDARHPSRHAPCRRWPAGKGSSARRASPSMMRSGTTPPWQTRCPTSPRTFTLGTWRRSGPPSRRPSTSRRTRWARRGRQRGRCAQRRSCSAGAKPGALPTRLHQLATAAGIRLGICQRGAHPLAAGLPLASTLAHVDLQHTDTARLHRLPAVLVAAPHLKCACMVRAASPLTCGHQARAQPPCGAPFPAGLCGGLSGRAGGSPRAVW